MIPSVHVETGVLIISLANTFLPYSNIFQSGIGKNYLASPYLSSDNQAITDYINSIQQNPTIGDVDNTLQNSHSDNNFDEIPRKVHLKQGRWEPDHYPNH